MFRRPEVGGAGSTWISGLSLSWLKHGFLDRARLRAAGTATTMRKDAAVADTKEQSGAGRMFGDFAPALVGFTDDVLFGQVWKRPDLAARERSLITVASLVTSGSTDQLVFHLGLAKQNGATEQELIEVITHLAFYAGWPKAMAAMTVAKKVFRSE
jgi:4-carboxymuconolactone decarboxylase